MLPLHMEEALSLARGSAFVEGALPPTLRERAFARAEELMARYDRDPESLLREQLLRY